MPASSAFDDDAAAVAAARRLCPQAIASVERAGGGGNSRLYRIVGVNGGAFALKSYPPSPARMNERAAREFAALSFVTAHDPQGRVPTPLAVDDDGAYGLYEWIEGSPVREASDDDVTALLDFALWLRESRRLPQAEALPEAAEATPSLGEIIRQIAARRARFATVARGWDQLDGLLRGRFDPLFAAVTARAREAYRIGGLEPDRPLPRDAQTLSPSDFGFHNALRRADGCLAFLDFEYFGWDDPVRLVADLLWHPHPATALREAQRRRAVAWAAEAFGADDPNYARRFAAQCPLVGLRWTMILLNECLPERWAARVRAGETRPRNDVLAGQMEKALVYLQWVEALLVDGDDGLAAWGNNRCGGSDGAA